MSYITRPATDSPVSTTTRQTDNHAPWLSVVADNVKNLRYGIIQVIVHDSKVVQIERTERTRFDASGTFQGR